MVKMRHLELRNTFLEGSIKICIYTLFTYADLLYIHKKKANNIR